MLKLQDHPNAIDAEDLNGAPHAADESNIAPRQEPGSPIFVRWRAVDDKGQPVQVLVGFRSMNSARINPILSNSRDAIEAAANAEYKPGDSEVVLVATAFLSAA
ncbi:hypothetical protein QWJ07_30890 [Frankia sp. RB7]|nr:hypothetical protein [Frankia sp. RB7]